MIMNTVIESRIFRTFAYPILDTAINARTLVEAKRAFLAKVTHVPEVYDYVTVMQPIEYHRLLRAAARYEKENGVMSVALPMFEDAV